MLNKFAGLPSYLRKLQAKGALGSSNTASRLAANSAGKGVGSLGIDTAQGNNLRNYGRHFKAKSIGYDPQTRHSYYGSNVNHRIRNRDAFAKGNTNFTEIIDGKTLKGTRETGLREKLYPVKITEPSKSNHSMIAKALRKAKGKLFKSDSKLP